MRLSVVFVALAGVAPVAVLAQEPFEGRGYVIACGEEGCFLNSAGFDLFVAADQGAGMLVDLPMLAAVEVRGSLSEIGDSSAALRLEAVERVADDLYEGNLQAMQGDWRPVGEANPFTIGIYGMDWTEILMEEEQDRFMMSVGDACADGVTYAGMAISLYRYGDDPGADACWGMEFIDDARMSLRDLSGDFGVVDFERVID
ncbi:hypothetical protein [Tabrizicola sp. M-4]|uniref:hypothetical protein n=1 Tax=Tabrizicola sp. M-4 TaxID=3055847 RepID=UPI003DA8584A